MPQLTLTRPFHQELTHLLQKKGYRSLRDFYQRHSFSFSYEYLRQVLAAEKIPRPRKVREIADAFGIDASSLQKQAMEAKLAVKIRRHYELPEARLVSGLAHKVKKYKVESARDLRIAHMIGQLPEKEKGQLLDYLRFLRKQGRKQNKGRG